MSPALLSLILALIQQAPAAIAAGQALIAQLESGTAPTEAQIEALAQQYSVALAVDQADIAAAGQPPAAG